MPMPPIKPGGNITASLKPPRLPQAELMTVILWALLDPVHTISTALLLIGIKAS